MFYVQYKNDYLFLCPSGNEHQYITFTGGNMLDRTPRYPPDWEVAAQQHNRSETSSTASPDSAENAGATRPSIWNRLTHRITHPFSSRRSSS